MIFANPSCNLTRRPTSVLAKIDPLAVNVTLPDRPLLVIVVVVEVTSSIGPRAKSTSVIVHAVWLVRVIFRIV